MPPHPNQTTSPEMAPKRSRTRVEKKGAEKRVREPNRADE
jgi:hypothetical protein